jgi:hypothetical protein
MIDFREFASALMRQFELAGPGEDLHLKPFDGGANGLIRHGLDGGEAEAGGAPE